MLQKTAQQKLRRFFLAPADRHVNVQDMHRSEWTVYNFLPNGKNRT